MFPPLHILICGTIVLPHFLHPISHCHTFLFFNIPSVYVPRPSAVARLAECRKHDEQISDDPERQRVSSQPHVAPAYIPQEAELHCARSCSSAVPPPSGTACGSKQFPTLHHGLTPRRDGRKRAGLAADVEAKEEGRIGIPYHHLRWTALYQTRDSTITTIHNS